ncbi:MAG: hypothetical protein ACRC91_02435 [Aeromonas sp.]
MYDGDFEYANSRLCDSVVRLDDVPVMVHAVNRDGTVAGSSLTDGKEIRCNLEDLNLVPVELGYVNYDGHAHYVMRKPVRRDWRQGLRHNNMISDTIPVPHLPWAAIAKAINNNYPTFEQARLMLKGKRGMHSIAWCRDFAIIKGWEVKHCGDKVGKVVGEKVVLDEAFQYLKEALEETL